ncbi:PTS IIA-like nitrogen regulatory protein PtsN [Thiohalorhabdus denitrificans]|uniref:PTS IIA-like nitrogen-regulatory protein PtsN n=1 Tax=Thiohalorhabdus denitrificans TaxID=381306 RepID=A0A1G5FPI4_9GAMM|nr:PTS IIA-like nitrogen regulatory protein PtsN [Thiohalorhabdus denitrificans]SCY41047.1 PTS IIA-like nitrogen-regulatory protein PtsN [Thiohalorhabdus denitrificans]
MPRNSPPKPPTEPEDGEPQEANGPIRVRDLLSRGRIRTDLAASSKKSLLDQLAEEFHADHPELDEREVFQTLLRREQLGSTAVGHGVALPHGRMADLDRPLGAFTRLEEPTDFDALDDQPVSLVFALLVPDEENDQHLQVLSRLARMLDDGEFRERLRHAPGRELYDLLVGKDEEMASQ